MVSRVLDAELDQTHFRAASAGAGAALNAPSSPWRSLERLSAPLVLATLLQCSTHIAVVLALILIAIPKIETSQLKLLRTATQGAAGIEQATYRSVSCFSDARLAIFSTR